MNVLLLIDPQTDFCSPTGSLYVPGAQEDLSRVSQLLQTELFDHVIISLDFHPIFHIAHPGFWRNAAGVSPAPFTTIAAKQVKNQEYLPISAEINQVVAYLEALESNSNFPHIIWPVHCVMGTLGAAIDSSLLPALFQWKASEARNFQIEIKGTNPLCEHFGIFEAQVPIPHAPETQINESLLSQLMSFEQIFIAGEAKSHCVANSLHQILKHKPEMASKIIVLEDCMSDVPNLGHLGEPIYNMARQMGVNFKISSNFI